MPRTFSYDPSDAATRNAAETAVFGTPLADEDEYANLIGDIARDAKLRIIFNRFFAKMDCSVPITIAAECSTHSTIVRLEKGMFDYSDCTVVKKGKGTGREIFKLVADTAHRLGFKDIKAEGRKHVSETIPCWGHIAYPGYGFDQPIPAKIAAELPDDLKHMKGVMELCNDPKGLEFWEKKGETLKDMKFNLEQGSPSWTRLNKGSIRKMAETPVEAPPLEKPKN
jgi:hypothetical protein